MIWQGTVVRMQETIPDTVLKVAHEILIIDLPPSVLLTRLGRGLIYPQARARAAREHFFKESALAELRERAMRQTPHVVETYDLVDDSQEVAASSSSAAAPERLLVYLKPDAASAALARRAHSLARCLTAECLACACPAPASGSTSLPRHVKRSSDISIVARGLGMHARILEGDDVAGVLVHVARLYDIGHIFVLHHAGGGLRRMFRRSLAQQVTSMATDTQVDIIVAESVDRGRL